MPALDRSYISNCRLRGDGAVEFECSTNREEWPWLALSPQHPLVIQTQNFWTSVGAGQALGTRDENKWSALTWTDWGLGDREAGEAARGVFSRTDTDGKLDFATELFDAQDRLIAKIRGKGVVFRTRDFESWRGQSKTKASEAATDRGAFAYAARAKLGLSPEEPALIAPLKDDGGTLTTAALITKENGLMPGHPYFSGSGDHVNTPHLAEVARQVACLLNDGASVAVESAEMDMHRYIELGTPFEISVARPAGNRFELAVSQLERSCATITMGWL